MSACPCGCNRVVPPNCTYATRTCWRRARAIDIRPRDVCVACPKKLLKKDIARGVRRCQTCRHDLKPQSTGTHQMGQGISISHGPKAAKKVETTSFWIGLTSAELNAEARRRHPGGDRGRASVPERGAAGSIAGIGR